MNSRTLNRILWPVAGATIGFLASVLVCGVQCTESYQNAKVEVVIFGHVIHEESGPPNSGFSDHVALTWGSGLNAAFSVLGAALGFGIAVLVNRASRTTATGTGVVAEPRWPIRRLVAAITRPECVLAAVATVTFPLAVLLPFFTLSPSFGDVMVDAILAYLFPGSTDPRTYCVLGGIAALFMDGDVVVAVVLLLFSVLFPSVKLALLWGVLFRPQRPKLSLVRKLEALGPWSMADVFVVSVLVVAFKGFPGGTAFTIEIGYYVFLVSVVTGLLATWLAKRRLERCQTQRQEAMVPLKAAACVKAADHVRIRRPARPSRHRRRTARRLSDGWQLLKCAYTHPSPGVRVLHVSLARSEDYA